MTGDFTRDTFRPARDYSAVRMQQGRLFTDADWNEEGDIHRGALRTTAKSVIGASGFPEDAPGFAILAGAGAQALLIGGGQAYVDGIGLSHAAPVRLALTCQSGSGTATRWRIDAGMRVAVGDYLVLAGNAPQRRRCAFRRCSTISTDARPSAPPRPCRRSTASPPICTAASKASPSCPGRRCPPSREPISPISMSGNGRSPPPTIR
ncbi:DUF6519 domain-containing protein [Sphingopyxis sp. PET50]|uniref:DUF6519 domain-containing protein n=1 Tax=Sphingopyxis sp. PET50 TaxID=2976533 RepID=UPI0021AFA78A|nr:DUF6519 domain-containing protein [Sphingopyxis sp. PET50]